MLIRVESASCPWGIPSPKVLLSGVVPDSQCSELIFPTGKPLRDKLTDRGYQINYVGSQVSGDTISQRCPARRPLADGWPTAARRAQVDSPHTFTIFSRRIRRTSSCFTSAPMTFSAGHASANDVRLILDEIDRLQPKCLGGPGSKIINQATPPCPLCTTTTAYNDALDAMVRTTAERQ